MPTLRQIHAVASIGHVASSSALLIISSVYSQWSPHLVTTVWKRDDPYFSSMEIDSIEAVWLLIVAGYVSGAHHAIFPGVEGARWADYAISSPLMVFVIGALSGVADVWTLVSMSVLQSVLMASSGVLEHASRNAVLSVRNVLVMWTVLSAMYCVGVWGPVFAALDYQEPPEWVWAIIVLIFLWFAAFGVVFFVEAIGRFSADTADKAYIILSLSAKIQLQWTLFSGTISAGGSQNLWIGVVSGIVAIGSGIGALLISRDSKSARYSKTPSII